MRHGIDSPKWIRHGLPVGAVVLLSALLAAGSALADPGERLTPFLRQYAAPCLYGFDQGINFLAETLGQRVPVQLGTEVTAVRNQGAKVVIEGLRDGVDLPDYFACILHALLP